MPEEKRELSDIEKKYYETLSAYFSERFIPTGLFKTIGLIRGDLLQLNQNLEESSSSSTKLTKALNRLTLCGVIVAGFGVVTAMLNLAFELFKYFNSAAQ